MSPEQALFTKVRQIAVETGIDTYDYLPGDVDYPFIFIGEQISDGVRDNKDARFITVSQSVHIYHDNHRQRGTISNIIYDLQKEIFKIKRVGGRKIEIVDDNLQILPDNTTNTPLLHGVLDITFIIK